MAWPRDARYNTFAALQEVSSDHLNEIQDMIIECFEERYFHEIGLSPNSALDWHRVYDTGLSLWVYKPQATSKLAHIQLPSMHGMRITEFGIKSYIDSSAGLTARLITSDRKASASATAPVESTVSTITPTTASGSLVWQWDENTGLSVDITDDVTAYITIETSNALLTDWVSGFRIKAFQNNEL